MTGTVFFVTTSMTIARERRPKRSAVRTERVSTSSAVRLVSRDIGAFAKRVGRSRTTALHARKTSTSVTTQATLTPARATRELNVSTHREGSTARRALQVSIFSFSTSSDGFAFTLLCLIGYTGDGRACSDLNECSINNGGCSMSPRVPCTNTIGSRTCGSCPEGVFALTCPFLSLSNRIDLCTCLFCVQGYSGDGVTCTFVGVCAVNNGGCASVAMCLNLPGQPES